MSRAASGGRAGAWVAGVCALSFVCGLLTWIFGDAFVPVSSAGSDAYSRSALGHQAFVETLRELDVPVLVSRWRSAEKAGDEGLLVVAEPRRISWQSTDFEDEGRWDRRRRRDEDRTSSLEQMIDVAGATLVILPKWQGEPDWERPEWIRSARLLDEGRVNEVLDALRIHGRVQRLVKPPARGWSTGPLGVAPTLANPQLLGPGDEGYAIEPIVSVGDSVLFGRVTLKGHVVFVLTDPDLVSNHGLGRGENALLAVRILSHALGDRSSVVFDEILHGHAREESLWQELFRFPLVLALGQMLLTVGVLLWAGMGRFGRALPPPPALEPGKRFLVDNTAELIRIGGHGAHALGRYLSAAVKDVAQRTHAPAAVRGAELKGWLSRAAKARGTAHSLDDLEGEVAALRTVTLPDPRRLVAAAGRIHRWKREMTDGRAVDS